MTNSVTDKIQKFKDLLADDSIDNTALFSAANQFRKFSKEFFAPQSPEHVKKIAVLSTLSVKHLDNLFHFLLAQENIKSDFYESEYLAPEIEVLNDDSDLFKFKPDYLIIFNDVRDIKHWPDLFSSPENINDYVKRTVDTNHALWDKIRSKLPNCQIFHSLFVIPIDRQLGGLESNYIFSRQSLIQQINLENIRRKPVGVFLVDLDYFASKIGKDRWFDEVSYFVSKQPCSLEGMILLARYLSRLVCGNCGKQRKCLVVDLDNTLWSGVIGDDGIEGIILDPTHPVGQAFIDFQNYLLTLKNRGVMLAICSKNTFSVAMQAIENHEHMVLKKDDFAHIVANWETKDQNILAIAKKLNIGLDAIVFFDDNPVERDLVKNRLPMVKTLNVPEDPALFRRTLEESMAFEWTQLSTDDLIRNQALADQTKRDEVFQTAGNYDDYLQSLQLQGCFEPVTMSSLIRFTQLINKTNQFNLRTQRYSEAEIVSFFNSDEYSIFQLKLNDRFSSYGIISCVVLKKLNSKEYFLDTWVMSCRVLKLGVESLIMNHLCDHLRKSKATTLWGEYIPTAKNEIVNELLPQLGFKKDSSFSLASGGITYSLDLNNFLKKQHFITVMDV